ncbi:MAG TPA: GNAT family N-acetyltransferase [Edaphobacter sp.]|jgi:amino-acid N-acetyltransferase|nr:GNAT family N-acetyltransferase [Edaphobacter sp.]
MALSLVQEPPAPSFSPSLAIPFIPTENELTTTPLQTRKARLQDARSIHQLIHSFTHDGTLLPRRYAEICANISTFTVVETGSHQFIGCAALHVYGPHLAEIRSIVVHPDTKGHGAGSLLVHALLDQAQASGIQCVCLFTRIPAFFRHFHFRIAERQALPDKVLKDCVHCARRNACDEIAMAIGELPPPRAMPWSSLFHPRHHADLVQLQL